MAILTKAQLEALNQSSFPNNNAGAITPEILRTYNTATIDTLVNSLDTGSFATSAITASSLITASAVGNTITFTKGDASTFDVSVSSTPIDTGSLVTTASFNAYTSSNDQRVSSLEVNSGSVNTSITNLNSFSSSQLTQNSNLATYTGSVDTFITSSAQRLDLIEDFTQSADISITNINSATASLFTSASLTLTTASVNVNVLTFTKGDGSTFDLTVASGSSPEGTVSSSAQILNYGIFATTGSNTFRGNETFEDAGGNASTLVPTSGSLMLVAKGFTSASAHLSASAGTFVNLIFKNSDTTPDTIISGSNNIFVNPSAPTAGFKRYIGTSNHYTHGNSVPQISGSMAWSPSLNGNILSHTQINSLTWRGPSSLSSGAGNVNHNILMGGSMNLGTSAVNNFEKATAGVNITGNALFNGTFNQIANTTTLVNSIATSGNLIFGGQVNLNHISSSISYNSNVTNGSTTVNNRFSPTGASPAILSPRTNTNTLYGTGHVINLDGTNVGATQGKSFNFNILAGTFLTASVPDGDACSVLATGMIGNGLIVSGSTLAVFAGPETANSGQGSMFLGRFNAQDGNKAKTAETIFAVGTGTSYANRKTGFLIDSGSNSFFEGTLNVSGSTTMTGSLILSSSNAIELQVIGNSEFTGSVAGNVVSASITSDTASIDFSLGNYFEITSSVTPLHLNVTNISAGRTSTLIISASASSSILFSPNVSQPSGSAYSGSEGSIDILSLVAFNTSKVNLVATKALV